MDISNMFGGAEMRNSQQLRFEEFVPSSGWIEDSDTHCLIILLPGFKRNDMNLKVDDNRHIVVCGERQGDEFKRIRFEQSYAVPENSNIDDISAKFDLELLVIVIPKIIKAEKEPHPEITNVPEAVEEEKGTGLNNVADKAPQAVLGKEVKGNGQITDAAASGSIHESDSHNHRGNEESSDEESEEEEEDDKAEEEEEETTTEEEGFRGAKMENQSSLIEKLGKKLKKNKGILIATVLAFSLGVLVSQRFQPNEK